MKKRRGTTNRPMDLFDAKVRTVFCVKCGTIIFDCEPFGPPEFYHKINEKTYCPNQGMYVTLGMPGIAEFRKKTDRRARNRGARAAGKAFRKNK